jgi:hypothetical protein
MVKRPGLCVLAGDGAVKGEYEVIGKFGFRARYVKEVDEREETIKFYQESLINNLSFKKKALINAKNKMKLCKK